MTYKKGAKGREKELGKINGYCMYCGEFVVNRWDFCPACGKEIEEMVKYSLGRNSEMVNFYSKITALSTGEFISVN